MPRVEAEVGSTANSYEILAKLATGGMAEIFLARGASTAGVERYVVLKRILKHRAADAAFVRMFLDEARLAAQLQHHNIAQVYDIGKLGDSYFFTMEYVHGETVRALLQRSHALRSPIPIGSVLVIGAGSAAGLHHAHGRIGLDGRPLGIVHRDVSPSNLMVSYEGGVKVVDFGVAKAAHRSQETRSGTVKGKISYLSPEQCRGSNMDRRSDLFSLGIVLWEMLTLERLYKRATDFEAMAAIVNEPPPPPSTRRADIPPELDAIVMKLLSKDPDHRHQSADELHEAIESVAVRIGTALSSASLARYLRDLFGQRPEPWIEMQSRETHPEVFTVTSEPVPADLGIRPADELDLKLNAVPDLSAITPADSEQLGRPPSDGGLRTAPFRTTDSDSSEHVRPVLPTTSMRAPGDPATTLPYPLATPNAPTMIRNESSRPHPSGPHAMPGSGPHMMPGSGSHAMPRSNAPSSSYPSIADYPSYAERPPEPIPSVRRTPRIVYVVVGAVALGIIVGIVLAVSGGSSNPPLKTDVAGGSGDTVASTKVDPAAAKRDPFVRSAVVAGTATVDTTGSADTGSASTGAANTGAANTGATNTGAANTGANTGANAGGSKDGASNDGTNTGANTGATNSGGTSTGANAGGSKDGASKDGTNTGAANTGAANTGAANTGGSKDGASKDGTNTGASNTGASNTGASNTGASGSNAASKDSHAKDKDAPKRHPPPAHDTPDDQLTKQMQASHYSDAVATCTANQSLLGQNAPACVLAACHTHDAVHARRWLLSVGANKKTALINACKSAGTSLDAPAGPKPDCVADPMACQH